MASTDLGELLLRRWDLAAAAGFLRTNVDDTLRRHLPGALNLIVQFNPNHVKSKRPVDEQLLNSTTGAKPAASAFNFTKAKKSEFLCGLRFDTEDEKRLPLVEIVAVTAEKNEDEAQHFILVNVAPLVHGHFLFVPDLNDVRPQKMEKRFLEYGLSISQAMKRADFSLGFNSSGAWSSVNHFHLQGYFFPQVEGAAVDTSAGKNFAVTTQLREKVFRLSEVVVKVVPCWKTSCYIIEPEDADADALGVAETAWRLLEILQSREIPHNLLIVGSTVFIFPRQQQCENGVGLFADSDAGAGASKVHTARLRIAVAELSGLVIAGDGIAYNNLTEEMFSFVLQNEVSLTSDDEEAVLAEWKAKLGLLPD